MTLFISESEVDSLADLTMAMEAVEEAFRLQGQGKSINLPRRRVGGGHTTLQLMGGAWSTRFVVNLYRDPPASSRPSSKLAEPASFVPAPPAGCPPNIWPAKMPPSSPSSAAATRLAPSLRPFPVPAI